MRFQKQNIIIHVINPQGNQKLKAKAVLLEHNLDVNKKKDTN